ncbi:MAG: GIY-YIG nuclease family protein [Candidatus Nanohaloarchaea archaeon]
MKGSYSLIIKAPEEAEVGALGLKKFESDYVVYNGSAFGPGGLKRVFRHFSSDNKIHWHIDYLLEKGTLEVALIFPDKDLECSLSQKMDAPVDKFGSSDCGCNSHLFQFSSFEAAFQKISSVVSDVKVMDKYRYQQYKNSEDQYSKDDVLRDLPGAEAYKKSGNL